MKSFFPSTNNNLNISNLVNDSDSNNSEKKNVHIENFHSIIDHAKNKVNEIYNDNPYSRYWKSSERKIKKKLKGISTIKTNKKIPFINQTLYRKLSIRNNRSLIKNISIPNHKNNTFKKKLSSKISLFLGNEIKVLEEINKVDRDLKRIYNNNLIKSKSQEKEKKIKKQIKKNYSQNNSINKNKILNNINSQINKKENQKETISTTFNENNNKNTFSIPNLKMTKSIPLINNIIKSNSPLGNIYNKCINNIKLGEKMLKYFDDEKLKSNIENKIKDNKYKFHLTQLDEKNFLEKLDNNSFQKKMEKLNIKLNNNISTIDADKISSKFAYKNRKEYLNIFKGQNIDDKDFIFKKEFYKLCDNKFRSNKKLNNHNKQIEIEKMLEKDLKEKKILLDRLKNDNIKYYSKDYFFKKVNYTQRNNNTLELDNSSYLVKNKSKIILKKNKYLSKNNSLSINNC